MFSYAIHFSVPLPLCIHILFLQLPPSIKKKTNKQKQNQTNTNLWKCREIFINIWCHNQYSFVIERQSDHGNLRNHLIGGFLQFPRFNLVLSWQKAWLHTSRHGDGDIEYSTPQSKVSRKKESHSSWLGPLKSQSPPLVTQSLPPEMPGLSQQIVSLLNHADIWVCEGHSYSKYYILSTSEDLQRIECLLSLLWKC